MNKRPTTSATLPVAKRTRHDDEHHVRALVVDERDVFPTVEEIVHHIFSYLDAEELCTIQLVSKFWNRLAADNQLWKSLFQAKHPLHRLRGGKSSYSRPATSLPSTNFTRDHREIRPLPHRAAKLDAHRQDYKSLYRIAQNWERGRCAQSHVNLSTARSDESSTIDEQSDADRGSTSASASETKVASESARCAVLAGPFIAVAVGSVIRITTVPRSISSEVSASRSSSQSPSSPGNGDSKGKGKAGPTMRPRSRRAVEIPSVDTSDITVLVMDQSPSLNTSPSTSEGGRRGFPVRLAAFHRSGHFDVFSFMLREPFSNSSEDENDEEPILDTPILPMHTHLAPPTPSPPPIPHTLLDATTSTRLDRVQNIVSAAYHHPLLITLSAAFHVLIYVLPSYPHQYQPKSFSMLYTGATSPMRPILSRALHSFTSHAPCDVSLTRAASSSPSSSSSSSSSSPSGGSVGGASGEDVSFFRLVLTYCVAVYPAHWTAGAAEMTLSLHTPSSSSLSTISSTVSSYGDNSTGFLALQAPDVKVTSSRTASALPYGWFAQLSSPEDDEREAEAEEGHGDAEQEEEEGVAQHAMSASSFLNLTTLANAGAVAGSSMPAGTVHPSASASTNASAGANSRAGASSNSNSSPSRPGPSAGLQSHLPGRTRKAQAKYVMEQWGRKVGRVIGTQTDGKWIVLAGEDNVLQVYRLHRPSTPSSPMSITFVRSLFGHTAGIAALRVADGRCVTLGREGRLWVWDLEASATAAGVSVDAFKDSSPNLELNKLLTSPRESLTKEQRWRRDAEAEAQRERERLTPPLVVFDEHRAVTSLGRGGVDVWGFDL